MPSRPSGATGKHSRATSKLWRIIHSKLMSTVDKEAFSTSSGALMKLLPLTVKLFASLHRTLTSIGVTALLSIQRDTEQKLSACIDRLSRLILVFMWCTRMENTLCQSQQRTEEICWKPVPLRKRKVLQRIGHLVEVWALALGVAVWPRRL